MSKEPSEWTNGAVVVTAKTRNQEFKLEISNTEKGSENNFSSSETYIQEENGIKYQINKQTITKNFRKVTARLSDGKNATNNPKDKIEVTNIDTLSPTNTAPDLEKIKPTHNKIEVTLQQKDAEATADSGCSGLDESQTKYRIKKSSDSTFGEWQKSNVFKNLKAKTSYDVQTIVQDKAGNDAVSSGISTVKTKEEPYDIKYNMNGGTNSSSNPIRYTIDSSDITLKASTRTGYTFIGWTEQITPLAWTTGWLDLNSGDITTNSSIPEAVYSNLIFMKSGVKYTINGISNTDDLRYRAYDVNEAYIGNQGYTGSTFTPNKDMYVRLLIWNSSNVNNKSNISITVGSDDINKTIPTGSTGNRLFTANWKVNSYTISYDSNYLKNNLWPKTINPDNYSNAGTTPSAKNIIIDKEANRGAYIEFVMNAGTEGGPYFHPDTKLTANKTYTYSVEIKTSSNKKLRIGDEQNGLTSITSTTSWQKIKRTFTANDNSYFAFIFYVNGDKWSSGDKLYVRSLQIEEGDGSQNIITQIKNYDTALGTLPTLSRAGYNFIGWFNASVDGNQISSSTKVPANNITYYAHWKDDIAPTTVAPTLTKTTKSVTVANNQTDSGSGVKTVQYQIKKNSDSKWGALQTSNKFDKLIQNTKYDVRTYTTDNAGNSSYSGIAQTTTETVPSGDITFSISPSGWTNGNVTVTAATKTTGFTLQTSLDKNNWNSTATQIVTENLKYVYAQLWDGTNAGKIASIQVTNIDKVAPTAPIITAKLDNANGATYTSGTWTNKPVYIKLTSTDTLSGIAKYQWYENSAWTERAMNFNSGSKTSEITYTANRNGITMRFKAIDNVGNSSGESTIVFKCDYDKPTTTKPILTATTNSITATNKQTDALSGVKTVQYQIKKNSDTTWGNLQNSNVFTGLIQNVKYDVRTHTTDNAGNSSDSAIESITTGTVPKGEGNITMTYTPTGWTNGNVTVTATTSVTGFKLITRIPGATNWTDSTTSSGVQTGTQTATTYGQTIQACLFDGTNYGEAKTLTITNIDKVAPTFTKVEIKNVTTTGYDVYVYGVADTLSGVNRVSFKVWAESEGENTNWDSTVDSVKGTDKGSGTWYYRVNTTDHGNNAGKYYTDVYIYDNVNNSTRATTTTQSTTIAGVTATFDPNGGNTPTPPTITKPYNVAIGTLPTVTRTGYTFAGWYTAKTGGTKISSTTTMPSSNVTYYAHWTANKYTITYDSNMKYEKNIEAGLFSVTDGSDSDGAYHRVSLNKTSGTENTWGYLRFPYYQFEAGATYTIRVKIRVISVSNCGVELRHSAVPNDYWTSGRKSANISSGTVGKWVDYSLTTTFASTYTQGGTNTVYNTNPCIEFYTENLKLTDTITSRSITFDYKDVYVDKVTTSKDKEYGTTLGTLPTSTRIGHTSSGFYTARSGGTKIASSTPVPAGNTTYYEQWTANNYTATFNANGGNTPNPTQITKAYDTALGTLPTTTRTGYIFAGWYTQASGGTQISSTTTMPSSNVTYYAHWTPISYTVNYNGNGSTSGSTASSSHTYDVAKNLTTNGFAKTGYSFKGWAKSSIATSADYANNASVKNLSSTNGATVTLYAVWKDDIAPSTNKPTLTSTTNKITATSKQTDSGSGINKIQYQIKKNSDTAWGNLQDSNVFTGLIQNTKYDVRTYATDKAGNSSYSEIGQASTMEVPSGDITFTISPTDWTKDSVTVTAATKITGYTLQTSQDQKNWDSTATQTVTEDLKYVYARLWDGKNTGSVASTQVTNIDKEAPTCTKIEIKNITTTGYDVYVYGVTDNNKSGVNRVSFPTWTDNNGQDDIISDWNKTGSKAIGTDQGNGTWYYRVNVKDHKNESGKYYTHIYTYDNVGNSKNINNNATTNTITIPSVTATFNANGGLTPNTTTISKGYNSALGTLPTTTRAGYTFAGWYTASSGGTKISSTTTMPSSNVTYYAHWNTATYNITYNMNNGTNNSSNPSTYSKSTSDITIKAPTRTGYAFTGWNSQIKPKTWTTGWLDIDSGKDCGINSSYSDTVYTEPIFMKSGVTYTINNVANTDNIRYRAYDANESYIGNQDYSGSTFTPSKDMYIRLMMWGSDNVAKQSSITFTEGTDSTSKSILAGSTGDRIYSASWMINQYYYDVNPDSNIASFDITYGASTLTNQTDFYQKLDYNTQVKIYNIKPKTGYNYKGNAISGSLSKTSDGTSLNNGTGEIVTVLGAGNGAIALQSIDNIAPTNTKPEASVTTNKITVTLKQTDSGSGINSSKTQYRLVSDANASSVVKAWQTSNVFSGLTHNTLYYIQTQATDNAGNNTVSAVYSIATGKIPSNIEFTLSPSTWTNQNVTVTAKTSTTGFTLEISQDQSTWTSTTAQTATQTVTTYGNYVYARLGDGISVGDIASVQVKNIDKIAPTDTAPTVSATTSALTVTLGQTDSGGSGINTSKTQYRLVSDSNATSVVKAWQTSSTFSGLTHNTTYYVQSQVTDNAGNNTISKVTTAKTSKIPDVTLTPSTTAWTNQDVTVTATANSTVSGVTMQMQSSVDSTSWTNVSSLKVSSNQTVSARLTDNVSNGATASINITNIDKTAPTTTAPTITEITKNSLAVQNNQTDSESGIATYYYSINNGSWVSSTSSSYTFTGLQSGTTYSIKTKLTDKAGNSSETSAISEKTKFDVVTVSEAVLNGNIKVGDIVMYTAPPYHEYSISKTYTGDDDDYRYGTDTTYLCNARIQKWRVWSVNNTNHTIELMNDPTEGTTRLTLAGSAGYNNASKLLNDICQKLYTNSSKGITARSFDSVDIEKAILENANITYSESNWANYVTTHTGLFNLMRDKYYQATYGNTMTLSNIYLPNRYGTGTSSINITSSQSNDIRPPSTESYITGASLRSSVTLKDTWFGITETSDMVSCLGDARTNLVIGSRYAHWIASRYATYNYSTAGTKVYYGIGGINSMYYRTTWLYESDGTSRSDSASLCPHLDFASTVKLKLTNVDSDGINTWEVQ